VFGKGAQYALGVDHHAGRFSQQRGRKSQKSADCTACAAC